MPDSQSIPCSDTFLDSISDKYCLIRFNIPEVFRMLENARMIMSFDIVQENRRKKIRGIHGYVVAKGDIIKSLRDYYREQFLELYAVEFNKKIMVERALHEVSTRINEYNNTPIGRLCLTAVGLEDAGKKLQKNILNYSEKNQQKLLEAEMQKIKDIRLYLKEEYIDEDESITVKKRRRANDHTDFIELSEYTDKNSIEKALAVYGIDLYSRICFREYQFSFMARLIEDDIFKMEDLKRIKLMLQSVRANSDKDMKLQEYAVEINQLQKILNSKLS